jgi:transcriptional regulator with XRE-family HTH domain
MFCQNTFTGVALVFSKFTLALRNNIASHKKIATNRSSPIDSYHIRDIFSYMKNAQTIDDQIATRLKSLRQEAGLSLDELATRSGVSRASLSRMEKAEVSPTAQMLSKLCSVYGISLSRLLHMAEESFPAKVGPRDQPVWEDTDAGFVRKSVSPPAQELSGEVLECQLQPGTDIHYSEPPKQGLEHHLVMIEGALEITVGGSTHTLKTGDSFRYQLHGESHFKTPENSSARYMLFLV